MPPREWAARWRIVENDDGLVGPAWAHHAFKAITGLLTFEGYFVIAGWAGADFVVATKIALASAILFYIVLRVAAWLSTQTTHYTRFWTADLLCDFALHLSLGFPLACVYRSLSPIAPFAGCLIVYLSTFEQASP